MTFNTTFPQQLVSHLNFSMNDRWAQRFLSLFFLTVACILGGCLSAPIREKAPETAPQPTPVATQDEISVDNKIVRFGFRYSGRNIEPQKPVKTNTILVQENGSSDEQLFLILPAGRDAHTIQHIKSGLCWSIASTAKESPFRLQTCSPLLKAQQFTFTINSDGSYQILSDLSSLCLDIDGASKRAGASMIQWDCVGSRNQRVDVTVVSANPDMKDGLPNELSSLTGVDVYLVPQHSGKWIGLYEGGRVVGTPFAQMADIKKRQIFRLVNEGGGQYSIQHPETGHCIAIGRNSINNFGLAQLEPCSQPSSHFTLFARGQQTYQIKNIHSGRCLDIEAGLTTDSAKLVQWMCNGSQNQTFKVIRAQP